MIVWLSQDRRPEGTITRVTEQQACSDWASKCTDLVDVEGERQLIHASAICFSVVFNREAVMKQKLAVAFFAITIKNLI